MCFLHRTFFLCPRCEARIYEGPVSRERCDEAQLRRRICALLQPGSDDLRGAADLCDECRNDDYNNLHGPETQPRPRPRPQPERVAGGHQPPSDVSDDLPLPPDRPVRPLDEGNYHPHQREPRRGREQPPRPRPRPQDHGAKYDDETISLESLSVRDPHERDYEHEPEQRGNDNNNNNNRGRQQRGRDHERDREQEWDRRRNPPVVESTWKPSKNHNHNIPGRSWTDSQPPSYYSGSISTGRSREGRGPLGIIRTRDEDGHSEISFPLLRPGSKVKKDGSGRLVQERRKW
ncbi:hypothetical protein PV05_10720 [Exophiala xenobiotica]|uniref:Stc1 domain-containing protein n=1 Tax=Exophiala xenobiotica TaxID=348802 RepID=A0A0D2E0U4_9EURO|nr:uncharacterized protein PV05_10720 [Exophiala xenobiotica]KIW49003.1 hypothetical protein PV05_10720 [Exophiala xenobiotica]